MGEQTETELPRPPDPDGVDRVVCALQQEVERLELQDARDKPSTVPSKVVVFFRKRLEMPLAIGLLVTSIGIGIYSALEADKQIAKIPELEKRLETYKHTPDDLKFAAEGVANCMSKERRNDKGITDDEMSAIAATCKARTLQQFGIKTSPPVAE